MSPDTIINALTRLDHDDDSQWTPEGLPRVSVVQRLAGDTTITLRDIRQVAPDFCRVLDPLADPLAEPVEVTGSLDVADPVDDVQVEADQVEDVPLEPEPPMTVHAANQQLADSHIRLAKAHEGLSLANARVAACTKAWQVATRAVVTPDALIREHLRSEQAARAERVANGNAGRRPPRLGSAVDSFAFHTRAMGRSAGGGRSFARGGLPSVYKGRPNLDPRRGTTANIIKTLSE
jgi:hypothetical protein